MTYNKKTIPFVFAFAALMLAWPLTAPQATADGGTTTIPGICGVSLDSSYALGDLTKGIDGTETAVFTITTDGNTPGTLEVTPGDWLSVGNEATGTATLVGVADGTDSVTIGSATFTGTDANTSTTFDATGNDAADAAALVTAIGLEGTQATAKSVNNLVLVASKAVGSASSAVTFTDVGTTITLSGSGTLDAGQLANIKIMESTATKFVLKTDGTSPTASSSYASKTALGADAVKTIMATETDPDQDVKIIWHISGDSTFVAANEYQGDVTQDMVFSTTCNV